MKLQYYIVTIGCQMNKSDSERISFYLERFGFINTDVRKNANLVVINTCGIRQSAEDRAYGLISQIKKDNPDVKIVLTGCISNRKDVQRRLRKHIDIWLNITELSQLYVQLNKLFSLDLKKYDNREYLEIEPKLKSKFSAFIPIGNGCDNFCSYCVVPYARGREKYRDANNIIREVEGLVKKGYKEIILIAQNVNSYIFKDLNGEIIKFPNLLQMVADIKGDFWIKFSTSHPKDMSDELIEVISVNEKICNYIHLPVQSGNNEVLKNMNRKYTIEHYNELINKIKLKIKDAVITTDVIVGFPGETVEQFLCTVELFKKVKFDMAYISQYSARPNTKANDMEDNVSREEKKNREEKLMKIVKKTAIENNKKYIKRTYRVLIERKNKHGYFIGKIKTSKNVIITNSVDLNIEIVGQFVNVKIVDIDNFRLVGLWIK